MKYLVIRDIQVQAANALACNFIVNSAPIFACVMFCHALQRKTGFTVSGVAVNHLDAELLAENSAPFYSGAFQPQQRMGAVLINKKDYAGAGIVPSLSFQPTVSQHLLLSLVLATPDDEIPVDAIKAFLDRGKLAGGTITAFGEVGVYETSNAVMDSCNTGFWLVSRPDLLSHGPSMLEQFLMNATSRDESWVTPMVIGYAAITGQEHRNNVRALMSAKEPGQLDIPLHAFAEPLVALGQYVSVHEYQGKIPLWSQTFPRHDVWLIEQTIYGEKE